MMNSLLSVPTVLIEPLLLAARIIAFGFTFALFPRSILSLMIRFGCMVIIFFFLAPSLPWFSAFASKGFGGTILVLNEVASPGSSNIPLPIPSLLFQILVGISLGWISSSAILATQFFGSWCASFFFSQEHDTPFGQFTRQSFEGRHHSPLGFAIFMTGLSMFLPFFPDIIGFLAQSFQLIPLNQNASGLGMILPEGFLYALLVSALRVSFLSALLFALPVFSLFIFAQVLFCIVGRVFPAFVGNHIVASLVSPCLLLLISFLLYSFTNSVTPLLRASFLGKEISAALVLSQEGLHGK